MVYDLWSIYWHAIIAYVSVSTPIAMIKRSRRLCLLFYPVILLIIACRPNTPATPVADSAEHIIQSDSGLASYYSRRLDGKETASGKIFDSDSMVAAHPDYPLGTHVRLTNLENEHTATVEVKIIDRGPSDENQQEGVIIDVSRAAAKKLGMIKDGRVKVKVDVLQWGTNERE